MNDYIVWIHAAIAAIGTIFFLLSYLKSKQIYQLLFVIWFPITLLNYVSSNKVYIYILGAVQLVLFLAVLFFLFRRQKGGLKDTLEQLDEIGKETPEEASVDGEAGANAEAEVEKTEAEVEKTEAEVENTESEVEIDFTVGDE